MEFRQCLADFANPSGLHRRAPRRVGRVSRSGWISCFDACLVDALSHPIRIVQSPVNSTSVRVYAARVYARVKGFISSSDQLDLLRGSSTTLQCIAHILTQHQEYVGYAALSDACDALIKHPVTFDKTLGCLLSLSVHDFAVIDLFVTLQASCHDLHDLDIHFLEFAPSLGTIHLPGVFKIVWEFVLGSLATNGSLRLMVYKLLEHLTRSSHRNLAVLSMLGILTPMFSNFISSSTVDQQGPDAAERRLQCKIVKRLFEMGASTRDAQRLFQCAVKEDKSLDAEMIDLIRSGLKSKWPPHILFQDMSSVTMPLGSCTTLPASGLTFLVSVRIFASPHCRLHLVFIAMGMVRKNALRGTQHIPHFFRRTLCYRTEHRQQRCPCTAHQFSPGARSSIQDTNRDISLDAYCSRLLPAPSISSCRSYV